MSFSNCSDFNSDDNLSSYYLVEKNRSILEGYCRSCASFASFCIFLVVVSFVLSLFAVWILLQLSEVYTVQLNRLVMLTDLTVMFLLAVAFALFNENCKEVVMQGQYDDYISHPDPQLFVSAGLICCIVAIIGIAGTFIVNIYLIESPTIRAFREQQSSKSSTGAELEAKSLEMRSASVVPLSVQGFTSTPFSSAVPAQQTPYGILMGV